MIRRALLTALAYLLALAIILATAVLLGAEGPANAATFTVNSTAHDPDANPGDGSCATAGAVCTLRAAIEEANALAGADTINRSVSGTVDASAAAFPTITEAVTIDFVTGASACCSGLDCSAANWPFVIDRGGATNGAIVSTAASTTIRGLEIMGVAGSDSNGYAIKFEAASSTAKCNYVHGNWGGILSAGSGGQIGGASSGDANWSANNHFGITVSGGGSVLGNLSGTNANGLGAVPNASYGIYIEGGDANTISGNLAAGNTGSGIYVGNTSTNTTVTNNLIGRNRTDTADLCNGFPQFDDQGTGTTESGNSVGTCIPLGCCNTSGLSGFGVTCWDINVSGEQPTSTAVCQTQIDTAVGSPGVGTALDFNAGAICSPDNGGVCPTPVPTAAPASCCCGGTTGCWTPVPGATPACPTPCAFSGADVCAATGPTWTATGTATSTATVTNTSTRTATATNTATRTNTATATATNTPAGQASSDMTSALIALWRCEDSSSPAVNAEGDTNNNLTWAGSPTKDTTNFREGAASTDLDSGDTLACNVSTTCTELNLPSNYNGCIGTWYRPDSVNTSGSQVGIMGTLTGSDTGFGLLQEDAIFAARACNGNCTNATSQTSSALSATTWAWLMGCFDGTNSITKYKNGATLGSAATHAMSSGGNFTVGNVTSGYGAGPGQYDEAFATLSGHRPSAAQACKAFACGWNGALCWCDSGTPANYRNCTTDADCGGVTGSCDTATEGDGQKHCTGHLSGGATACNQLAEIAACNAAAP